MLRSSPNAARVVLLAGLMAWVLGQWAALKHQIEILHVRCAEHGEVIELGDASEAHAAAEKVAQITAPDTDEHDHGCGILLLTDAEKVRAPLALAPPAAVFIAPLKATPAAPRGPPLAYAPKTSPPLS